MTLCYSLPLLVAVTVAVNAAPVYDNSSFPPIGKMVNHPEEYVVPGEYIVTVGSETDLDGHVNQVSKLFETDLQGSLLKTFLIGSFKAYHVQTHDNGVLQSIAAMEEVESIEPNVILTGAQACSSHDTANWGLTRVNFDRMPNYDVERRYHYSTGGSGVNIYLLDSGVKKTQDSFTGSDIYYGHDFIDVRNSHDSRLNTDEHGHGTGIAAAMVSACCGVAKQATLIDVRILNENLNGNMAIIIEAMQWVYDVQRSSPTPDRPWTSQPALINLSVQGFVYSQALDDAMRQLYDADITIVVASGNSKLDACTVSPGGSHYAITVAATDQQDAFWFPSGSQGSNYGKCVDILAPGVAIEVPARQLGVFQIATGTSIAAPFVTGTLAKLVSKGISTCRPGPLSYFLLSTASTAPISNLQPKTTNRMVHMECV